MRKGDQGFVFQDMDRLFRRGTVASGDGALLESFLSESNEAAFEALVNRHGPMVRGVCRRILADPHDADDAFQATFLVLVRKGKRLRDPDRLGPWLHGVATREALKARAGRRRNRAIVDLPAREDGAAEWWDVTPIIDAELARLPAKHREVLVACLLEGATAEEASHRLACPVGTVKSRLARAREALRARLTSRGVAPALALAVLETNDALAFTSPVSTTLARATLKTAATTTVAPGVAALIKGVATIMLTKFSFAVLAIAGLGAAGLGAAAWIKPSLAQVDPPPAQARRQTEAKTADRPPDAAEAETEANDQRLKLTRLLRAVHGYVATTSNGSLPNGSFPPTASVDAAGRPLLSWRVAILPYLDQTELYVQFHLNEPWDSPHNKTLIDRMPAVFETRGAGDARGRTRIRGFAGKGTVFDPALTTAVGLNGQSSVMTTTDGGVAGTAGGGAGAALDSNQASARPRGAGLVEITDGTSNTIFVAVVRDPTVWTRPGELPFVPGQDLPALDESDSNGYVLGMCDGSVRLLKKPANPTTLTALITRGGGEVVSTDVFFADKAAVQPTAGASAGSPVAPAEPASASSSVETRLQALERKVDRILEKLDAQRKP